MRHPATASVLKYPALALILHASPSVATAQDSATTLLLRFDNSLTGAAGETATLAPASPGFRPAAIGRGFDAGAHLRYPATGNINPRQGTLEFWVRPNWNGNDAVTRVFLAWGGGGGLLFSKDGAGNLRSIFNRFGVGGQPERGVSISANAWTPDRWRHVAFTWNDAPGLLELYVDGVRVANTTFSGTLPLIADADFSVGSDNGFDPANATLDHLRISSTVRTAAEILASFRAGPLLNLRFEGSLAGDNGESPSSATTITYEAGVTGQGAFFPNANRVIYGTNNNILADEGTLEFWVKPRWNGNNNLTNQFLTWGSGGGMLFAKDGANNLRSIFNRFGGASERGIAINISAWTANTWRHVAYTWSNTSRTLELYVNAQRVASGTFTGTLPAISATTFQIGGEGTGSSANAVLDNLRITGRARTPDEISDSFIQGLTVTALQAVPATLSLYPTWTRLPALTATTNLGSISLPANAAQWSTSDPAVAIWDGTTVRTVGPGSATLTAAIQGSTTTLTVNVQSPARQPDVTVIAPELANPAECHQWEMPVAILRYIPTLDGVNVDADVAGWSGSVDALKSRIDRLEIDTKFMLEEGSRFRGYGGQTMPPSLGYRVVAIINVYEPLPPDMNPGRAAGPDVYFPDYNQILQRWNAANWVNTLGVKEVWLWGYHHGNIAPVESNMSSPTTGDISNSFRFADDLPIFNSTYVLYNYNYTRSQAEAVHNHGHQLESILSYVNQRQDGNTNLFWRQFSGRNAADQPITGRCGNTHMPPNTTADYDYLNPAVVQSDIRDWTPAGTGTYLPTSVSTWGDAPYAWPGGVLPGQRIESQWYIFWMQSMPGLANTIPNGAGVMTNWWWFTADWDRAVNAIRPAWGLYATPGSPSPTISSSPASLTRQVGQSAAFSANATVAAAGAPLTYQWLRNGTPLCNNARTRGATSAVLTLADLTLADAGQYTLRATGPGGTALSAPATLVITVPCPADIVSIGGLPPADGILTGDDFNAFINAFAAAQPLADITGIGGPPSGPDGLVTGDDFNTFIASFASGCP